MRSQAKGPVASWPAKTNSVVIMVHSSGTVLLHMYVVSYVKASLTFQAIGWYWNGGLYVCLLTNRNTMYFPVLVQGTELGRSAIWHGTMLQTGHDAGF